MPPISRPGFPLRTHEFKHLASRKASPRSTAVDRGVDPSRVVRDPTSLRAREMQGHCVAPRRRRRNGPGLTPIHRPMNRLDFSRPALQQPPVLLVDKEDVAIPAEHRLRDGLPRAAAVLRLRDTTLGVISVVSRPTGLRVEEEDFVDVQRLLAPRWARPPSVAPIVGSEEMRRRAGDHPSVAGCREEHRGDARIRHLRPRPRSVRRLPRAIVQGCQPTNVRRDEERWEMHPQLAEPNPIILLEFKRLPSLPPIRRVQEAIGITSHNPTDVRRRVVAPNVLRLIR